MRSETGVQAAYETVSRAARYASRTEDWDAYELYANTAIALGWVLWLVDESAGLEELLKGAKWAADQPVE